jgi:hypothetical protein
MELCVALVVTGVAFLIGALCASAADTASNYAGFYITGGVLIIGPGGLLVPNVSLRRPFSRLQTLTKFLFALAAGFSVVAVVLIVNSTRAGDASSLWALALVSVAIPLWVAAIVQSQSDVDWETQTGHLNRLSASLGQVDSGLVAIRDSLSDVVRSISAAHTAIDGLVEATDRGRQQAILAALTTPGDHRGFHGQASRLSRFQLARRTDLSGAVLDGCRWDHFEGTLACRA